MANGGLANGVLALLLELGNLGLDLEGLDWELVLRLDLLAASARKIKRHARHVRNKSRERISDFLREYELADVYGGGDQTDDEGYMTVVEDYGHESMRVRIRKDVDWDLVDGIIREILRGWEEAFFALILVLCFLKLWLLDDAESSCQTCKALK